MYENKEDNSRGGVYGLVVLSSLVVLFALALFLGNRSTPPNPPPRTPVPVHATATPRSGLGTPVVHPTATLRPVPTVPLPVPSQAPTAPIPVPTAQPTAPIPVVTAQPTSPHPVGTIPPPVGTVGLAPSKMAVSNR